MIKAVIFDLDGTLANTLYDLTDAVNVVAEKYGFKTGTVEEIRGFVGNGVRNLLERATEGGFDAETFEKILSDFLSYYGEHYCDKTVAYDGVPELLVALKSMGMKTAVVTNKEQSIARFVVHELCGDGLDIICGNIEGVPAKPDPTGTKMVMKELGVRPEECVFLGDSDVDVKTGIASGAHAVGETWGFRDRDLLLSVGAKHIIDRPCELLGIISKINNEQ